MIRKLIRKLRTKPKATRERVAIGAAGSVTAFVLVGWLVFTAPNAINVDTIVAEGQQASGLFSTMINEVGDQAAAFREVLPDTESSIIPAGVDLGSSTIEEIIETLATTTAMSGAREASSTSTTTGRTVLIATTSPETEN